MLARLFVVLFDETVAEMVYAPLWWYTRGAARAIERFRFRLHEANEHLALTIWIRNIFVPMYGQYDLVGRLISFIMRAAQIVVRGLVFLIWFMVSLALLIGYVLLPLLVFVQLYASWVQR